MSPRNKVEETIRKKLRFAAGSTLHDRFLADVLHAHEESKHIEPAPHGAGLRRMIMRSSMMRLAVAAAIIVAAGLGISLFIGTGTQSGVVWAEVAQKVEANRGFIFRQRIKVVCSGRPDEVCDIMTYNAGSQLRTDWTLQPEGPLFRSQYYDFDAETLVELNHSTKTCLRVPIDERTRQSQESGWRNAKDWVRQFLSSKYTKLGRRTIEGVPCEGIETTDSTLGGYADPPPARVVARLWVSVGTGYPFRLEYNSTHATADGNIQVEAVFDEFQWDAELSPSLFELNVPPDYEQRP